MQDTTPMTRPWADIVAHYESLEKPTSSIEGITVLTRYIRDSHLAKGLFAWTSMCDLCIAQTVVYYPYDGPYLRVQPLVDDQLEFRYIDTFDTNKQWCRTSSAVDAISRLNSFLDQLHWFSGGQQCDA